MIHRPELPSQILKRSVAIDRQKTSLSLEAAFWLALKEIAAHQRVSIPTLVRTTIAGSRRSRRPQRRRARAMVRARRPRSPLDPILPYVVLIVLGVIYFVFLYAHFAR